ncbi:hypothetical protein C8Q74DRAFT_1218501 [Fomes fomentarius]|nr:hypothetical protein C8Q74DRAFT_1218501 [Fomes fomentarius]
MLHDPGYGPTEAGGINIPTDTGTSRTCNASPGQRCHQVARGYTGPSMPSYSLRTDSAQEGGVRHYKLGHGSGKMAGSAQAPRPFPSQPGKRPVEYVVRTAPDIKQSILRSCKLARQGPPIVRPPSQSQTPTPFEHVHWITRTVSARHVKRARKRL